MSAAASVVRLQDAGGAAVLLETSRALPLVSMTLSFTRTGLAGLLFRYNHRPESPSEPVISFPWTVTCPTAHCTMMPLSALPPPVRSMVFLSAAVGPPTMLPSASPLRFMPSETPEISLWVMLIVGAYSEPSM